YFPEAVVVGFKGTYETLDGTHLVILKLHALKYLLRKHIRFSFLKRQDKVEGNTQPMRDSTVPVHQQPTVGQLMA
ncbi:hypothetical protein ACJMK2_040135, partial [Sinanodonta woodiana]